jgi:hypothetical protein
MEANFDHLGSHSSGSSRNSGNSREERKSELKDQGANSRAN